jgi:hypothetical protein
VIVAPAHGAAAAFDDAAGAPLALGEIGHVGTVASSAEIDNP